MNVEAGAQGAGGDWFARRTYGPDAFDLDDLAARKHAMGARTSVVLPSRNEAATVAGVVRSVATLFGTLVDEIVLVDASSTDGTREAAAAHGARVYQEREVFPELGAGLGKGDGMWRSLAVTSGDLVVFMDTDIANPGPHFVSSVLGPLLVEEEIQLVKGFYRRPILVGGVCQADEGGRVTELSARPLLNAFWPALGGLVQPLSGEFAARRSLLESIPFSTGYGVEIGILVDTFVLAGLEAIAQVDLVERVHRNQPITALSRMAFEVTQAAVRRIARQGLLAPGAGEHGRYLQFTPVESGRPRPAERDVNVVERPPLWEYAGRPR